MLALPLGAVCLPAASSLIAGKQGCQAAVGLSKQAVCGTAVMNTEDCAAEGVTDSTTLLTAAESSAPEFRHTISIRMLTEDSGETLLGSTAAGFQT